MKFNVGGNPALNDKETTTTDIIAKEIDGIIFTYETIRLLNLPPNLVATLKSTGLAIPWPTIIEITPAWEAADPSASIGRHTPMCMILLKAIIAFRSDCLVPE